MYKRASSIALHAPAMDGRRLLAAGLVLALACALLLGAWNTAAAAPLQQTTDGVVDQGETSLGPILVDSNGMSLYMFDNDTPGVSNCYDGCARRWPPLLIGAGMEPQAGPGVTAELGVTERTDGTFQVTANGWPLYYWFEDVAVGDVLGQAVGDVWWVMTPAGEIVRGDAAPAEAEATEEPAAEATEEPAAEATEEPAAAATEEPTAEATAEAAMEAAAAGPTVAWSDTSLGPILVDANSMTLYMFDNDTPGVSNCYDGCAQRWPPLLVDSGVQPVAADGITAELGVTERTDGTFQVTANGWPLYYWFEDAAPGDMLGQAVGDVWWVMSPAGEPMRAAAEAEAMAEATEEPTAEATAEAMTEATAEAMTEATAEPMMESATETKGGEMASTPPQMPVTGGSSILGALVALGGLLVGGGWVALRNRKR